MWGDCHSVLLCATSALLFFFFSLFAVCPKESGTQQLKHTLPLSFYCSLMCLNGWATAKEAGRHIFLPTGQTLDHP